MANRYYTSFPISPGEVILQGPEARHLATVMRARPGDVVCLFNGDGCEYPATVVAVSKRDVTLHINAIEKPGRELPFEMEIAAAVPKGDGEEFLLEKLTELGVTRFVPLVTDRSIVVPKVDRLRRTVIESSKQCGRNVLMEVTDVKRFEEYLRASASMTIRWMAHPLRHSTAPGPLSPKGAKQHSPGRQPWMIPATPTCPEGAAQSAGVALLGHYNLDAVPQGLRPGLGYAAPSGLNNDSSISIAIGPEGGFTDAEVKTAMAIGWLCVDLGPRVLRIETAAIALAAYCSLNANNA